LRFLSLFPPWGSTRKKTLQTQMVVAFKTPLHMVLYDCKQYTL
jgi:hypothetical protein